MEMQSIPMTRANLGFAFCIIGVLMRYYSNYLFNKKKISHNDLSKNLF